MAIQESAPAPKSRRLKVSHSTYATTETRKALPVPYLRLRGYWLQLAGFDVDQNVRVEIEDRCLRIVPAD